MAVGDFDPKKLQALVKARFGGWAGLVQGPGPATLLVRGRPGRRSAGLRIRGEQVHILMGHLGVPRSHPDFDALAVADHILGSGPGFTDRLSRVIRDELGLAYSVGGGMTDSADIEAGTVPDLRGTGPDEATGPSRRSSSRSS